MRKAIYVSIGIVLLLAGVGAYVLFMPSEEDRDWDGFYGSGADIPYRKADLNEMIVRSVVILRGRLRSMEPTGESRMSYVNDTPVGTIHTPVLEFTFDVYEYLKGTGGSRFTAKAYGTDFDWRVGRDLMEERSVAAARARAPELLAARDSRWDERDAIVFVSPDNFLGSISLRSDRFTFFRSITLRSPDFVAWVPAATSTATSTLAARGSGRDTGGKSGTSAGASNHDGQLFLLADPDRPTKKVERGPLRTPVTRSSVRSAASGVTLPVTPVMSVGGLKRRIAEATAEYGTTDGTREYDRCLGDMFRNERKIAKLLSEDPDFYSGFRTSFTSPSGVAAGETLHEWHMAVFFSTPDSGWAYGREWLEGRDAHLLSIRHPGHIYAERPLPVGEYEVFYNRQPGEYTVCNYYPEEEHNSDVVIARITAPAGTLAESFFDPYTSSTAVTGTTTVGTISWQSGRVMADLDIDVTGHALDFIGLDGTTTLSLVVADATEDGGTLTWTVPTQPWSAGDKLMLRVRRYDAPTPEPSSPVTITLSPRVEWSLTYIDMTIAWSDPEPCSHRYLVGLYDSSETVRRFLGYHPAPETTSLIRELGALWDLSFGAGLWARVTCASVNGSVWRVLGEAPVQSGFPDSE